MRPEDLSNPSTELVFPDVVVLRETIEIVLCRVGVKQVWVPRQLLPPTLLHPGDSGSLSIARGLAQDIGLV